MASRFAALACAAFLLAASADAMGSTAPIVRIAGTGSPAAYVATSPPGQPQPATQTPFQNANGIVWDQKTHRVLFVDSVDNRVFEISNGQLVLVAGNGSSSWSDNGDPLQAAIVNPTGITSATAADDGGIFAITAWTQPTSGMDTPHGGLRQWNSLTGAVGTLLAQNTLSVPSDLDGDAYSGTGLIADAYDGAIYTLTGSLVAGSGMEDIGLPQDVMTVPDTNDAVWVSAGNAIGTAPGAVWALTNAPTRAVTKLVGGGDNSDTDGELAVNGVVEDPTSIWRLGDGGYLVYDGGSHRIRRVSSLDPATATISTVAGNGTDGLAAAGTPANQAPLTSDGDISVSPDGILITQADTGTVELIPASVITSRPDALTTSKNATFEFTSWDDNATFSCRVDTGSFAPCSSGDTFGPLSEGEHTILVSAGTSGGTFFTNASATWTVDSVAPSALQLTEPADGATTASNAFSWQESSDAGPGDVHYELFVDDQKVSGDVSCSGGTCSASVPGLADGRHAWQVKAHDDAGNVTSSATRSFTELQPPTAALVIAPNPALPGRSVTFDASKSSDPNGQITDVAWDLDGDGSFETGTGTSLVSSKSYATPTTVRVQVRVTDSGSNTAVAAGTLVVTAVPPRNKPLGVSINDGAQYTNDPKVTVFAVWPSFASDAFVSNDGGFKNGQTFPVAEQIPWTLDSSGPERLPKTIYVRFQSGSQTSETYQDDIILDQTPPKLLSASLTSAGKAASAAAAKKVILKLKATDNVSGVSGVQATTNKRKPGKLLKYKKSLKVTPAKKLYVRVRDKAGNFSAWKTVKKR